MNEALERDGSLFTPGRPIWSESVLSDLHERFVQRPDNSSDSFDEKFKRQLAGAPADTIQLAGEIAYVYFLISMQLHGDTKRSKIESYLSWSPAPVAIPPELSSALDDGLVNAGRAFMQYKPFLLMYLIEFGLRWKRLTSLDRQALLGDPWKFKEFVFSIPAHGARTQQHALIHLVFPDSFEPTVSDKHKNRIAEHFAALTAGVDDDPDRKLAAIRQSLSSQYGADFSFYSGDIKRQWLPETEDAAPAPPSESSVGEGPRYWIEKCLVAGRPDRQAGDWALGHAIWSPQLSEDGRDYYRTMKEVRPGDVVLHFVDNREFAGISRVSSGPDTTSTPPPNTPWSDRASIRYELKEFVPLEPTLAREQLFQDQSVRARLLEILASHRGLFFNRNLELNQGAYLTEVPSALLKLLNDVYRHQTGRDLPHVQLGSVLVEALEAAEPNRRALTIEWLERETLWPQERLLELIEVLQSQSPQLILAGPPGTGKTWVALLLARYLTQDAIDCHRLVQFHPSYSYEAFMEGLRPVARNGGIQFDNVPGVVLEIAHKLRGNDAPYVLVVDEMNRANLPRVLGELLYLLEYRDQPADLPFTKAFRLPRNLAMIGTMNTADRSIRSIDVALRRRFDIIECPPDPDVLTRYYETRENRVPSLIEGFRKLNEELTSHLDRHRTIGHTFFMASPLTPDFILRMWRRKIGPLIEEYFFDQPDIAQLFDPGRFWPELLE